jgi:hypothetical protein
MSNEGRKFSAPPSAGRYAGGIDSLSADEMGSYPIESRASSPFPIACRGLAIWLPEGRHSSPEKDSFVVGQT